MQVSVSLEDFSIRNFARDITTIFADQATFESKGNKRTDLKSAHWKTTTFASSYNP